ncbi:NAD(P)/FAD-dependent oxidoreductase [Paenibacillus sp. UNC499MF]|uniref:flavin-containing monooxygenase n=1 Tax=Paenibacillus sp. UNC499MF TaxID=1502751 RepID=UPI0008A033FE|nr:NAD(P)/FAD-dependent oxidoreductase [Paenibacillus sp. UNC499MF]SEG72120.1 putative flavoprotein involved in K+ transport [Paenibacillus sp. UNC499MF]
MNHVEVIIIGGGQAGLAMGYFLKRKGIPFLILDAHKRTGDSWRSRYDSLTLFTPRMYSSLPGMKFPGVPDGLPAKDETADYLEAYAKAFDLPIRHQTKVHSLTKHEHGFKIETGQETFIARQVVVATGPFHEPVIPDFAKKLPEEVMQIHSSGYKNVSQLADGPVLVVGGGNSGAQIAVELSGHRQVTISASRPMSFKPMRIFGKNIFWYFETFGLLKAGKESPLGSWLKKQPEQVYGTELKALLKKGVVSLRQRAVDADSGEILFEDAARMKAANIIWATGFRSDYPWIGIPEAADANGKPIHVKGVSKAKGLYYVGLPWQTCRGSALLGWMARDAEYLAEIIEQHAERSG